jgi:hypothetical protein
VRLPIDLGGLFVEQEETPNVPSSLREFRLQPVAGHVRMSTLAMEASHVTARGAGHEAFMHLFADPFDAQTVAGFNLDASDAAELKWQHDVDSAEHTKAFRHKLALGAWGLSVASAAAGAAFWSSGHQLWVQGNTNPGATADAIAAQQHRIDLRYEARNVLWGVAGASAVTGALLWFWPSAPGVSIASTPGCEACLAYQRAF